MTKMRAQTTEADIVRFICFQRKVEIHGSVGLIEEYGKTCNKTEVVSICITDCHTTACTGILLQIGHASEQLIGHTHRSGNGPAHWQETLVPQEEISPTRNIKICPDLIGQKQWACKGVSHWR